MATKDYEIGQHQPPSGWDIAFAGSANHFANTWLTGSDSGWAFSITAQIRAWQGPARTVSIRYAIYADTGNPGTATLLGYTGYWNVTLTTSYTLGTLNLIDPVKISPNTRYGISVLFPAGPAGNEVAVGKATISQANSTAWRLGGVAPAPAVPPSPFGGAASVGTGDIPSIYANVERNVAPTEPNYRTPVSGVVVAGLTPTFEFTHNDANSDIGDKILGATLEVERVSDGARMWAPYLTATPAQQTTGTMSVVYGGSTLVPGTNYRWRVRTRDLHGIYGPYSTYLTFTVTNLGTMTMTGPATKTETVTSNTFTATWTHNGGLALTKARARLAVGGSGPLAGVVVWEDAAAGFTPGSGNVPNGSSLVFGQAQAGMPTLTSGVTYKVAVMGQDINGAWSPYSPYRDLRTNAIPGTPAALSPNTSQASTTRPLITFTAQDPDVTEGYPEPDLTASVRFKTSTGALRFTRAATLVDAAAGKWQYQVTAIDEPALAAGTSVSRFWDAQLNDGTTTSAWSAQAAYVYAAGPTVTITAPGASLTTPTGPITWTVSSTQVRRTVKIWAGSSATGTPIHSNLGTTSSQSYTIPIGLIYNGQTYTITVDVEDSTGVTGSSPTRTTTASFPVPPAVAGASAALVYAVGEPDLSRVRLSWQASTEPPDVFVSYRITRRFASQLDTSTVTLANLVNPSQESVVDEHAPTGGDLIYGVAQVTKDVNGFELLGVVTELYVEALDINATILVNVVDPSIRVALRFAETVEATPEKGRLELDTWAGGPALIIPTGSRRRVETATFNVVNDLSRPELMTAEETMAMIRVINASDSPVSVRDGRRPRWFAIVDATESDQRIGASDVSLTLTETGLIEGVGI